MKKKIFILMMILTFFICNIYNVSLAEEKQGSKKVSENSKLKEIYDKRMIETIKLFSQKKEELSKKVRLEMEDLLTIAAMQANEKNYENALFVLDEIDSILLGKTTQTKTIKVENTATGKVKKYQFDADNLKAKDSEKENNEVNKNQTVTLENISNKFSLDKLSAAEQKLYHELVNVLPIAEYEFNKTKSADAARRLIRLRRVFYTLKKKGMGFEVDDQLIQELITEMGLNNKVKKENVSSKTKKVKKNTK